jgi:hypothetical protein
MKTGMLVEIITVLKDKIKGRVKAVKADRLVLIAERKEHAPELTIEIMYTNFYQWRQLIER